MNWFLKKPDGNIYGPVEFATLAYWAEDNRINPDDLVSCDETNWTPAPEVAELGMDWVVDLDENSGFGPLHPLALRDLLNDGTVCFDSPARNEKTGETGLAGTLLLQVLLDQNLGLEQEIQRVLKQYQDLDKEAVLYRRIMEEKGDASLKSRFQTELKASLESRDASEREAVRWKRLYDDECERNVQHEDELIAQVRALREEDLVSRKHIEYLEGRIRDMERGQEFLKPGDTDHGSVQNIDAPALLAAYRNLSRNYDHLVEDLSAKSRELQQALESRMRIEQESREQIRLLDEVARRERQEADAARQRLQDMEERHTEFVHAYRDLNDRYIRIRHQMPETTAHRKEETAAPDRMPEVSAGPRIRLV